MSDEPKYRDEEWLREQYVEKGQTSENVADKCGCTAKTIRNWMEKYGIDRRPASPPADKRLADEAWLREQYVEQEKSTHDIATKCECNPSTVQNWIKRHEIDCREPGREVADERLTDESWLREQYLKNGLTSYEIAEKCECSPTTVRDWMRRHGIKRRTSPNPPRPELADERLTDEAWLREQYVEKGKSTREIAAKCGCDPSTVCNWMKRHGIDRRPPRPELADERLTDEAWLREQYVEKGKSTYDIAAKCECGPTTVREWMVRHGIGARAFFSPHHPNWTESDSVYGRGWTEEKRRRVRKRDGHKCVACGLTQTEHKNKHGQKLHVHHLIKARDVEDAKSRNAVENLITLCCSCHREWEQLSKAGIRPQIDGVTAD